MSEQIFSGEDGFVDHLGRPVDRNAVDEPVSDEDRAATQAQAQMDVNSFFGESFNTAAPTELEITSSSSLGEDNVSRETSSAPNQEPTE